MSGGLLAHLRLIQERTQQLDVTGDLRGLGSEEIFIKREPVPILIADGDERVLHEMLKVLSRFGNEFEASWIRTQRIAVTYVDQRLDFKQRMIYLTSALIHLINPIVDDKIHLRLTYADLLRDYLTMVPEEVSWISVAKKQELSRDCHLELERTVVVHLAQAGFQFLQKSNTKSRVKLSYLESRREFQREIYHSPSDSSPVTKAS